MKLYSLHLLATTALFFFVLSLFAFSPRNKKVDSGLIDRVNHLEKQVQLLEGCLGYLERASFWETVPDKELNIIDDFQDFEYRANSDRGYLYAIRVNTDIIEFLAKTDSNNVCDAMQCRVIRAKRKNVQNDDVLRRAAGNSLPFLQKRAYIRKKDYDRFKRSFAQQ